MEIDSLIKQESWVSNLYNLVKDSVWVIKFEGILGDESCTTYQTAFAVDKQGLLMTCAHGEWPLWSDLKIKARPTWDVVGFRYEADMVLFKPECDVSMFKLQNNNTISSIVRFGSGKVEVGEPIFLVGHPADYVGSGIVGRAAYPCIENAHFDFEGQITCGNYRCRVKSKTPTKRVMGHVWNKAVFRKCKENSVHVSFEKNLLSSIPVIQCYGLVGGGGSSGGPLFNSVGELVGMLVCGTDGFEIGIHVTLLRQLLEVVVRGLLEAESSKKKAGENSKKKAGENSKKKRKF